MNGIAFSHRGGFLFSKNKGMQLEAINFVFSRPLLDPFRNLSDFRKFSPLEEHSQAHRKYDALLQMAGHLRNFSNITTEF